MRNAFRYINQNKEKLKATICLQHKTQMTAHPFVAIVAVALLVLVVVRGEQETLQPQTSTPATPSPLTPTPTTTTTTTTTTTGAPSTSSTTSAPIATTTTTTPLTVAPTTLAPIPPPPTSAPAPTSDPRCLSMDNTSAFLLDFNVPFACPAPQACLKAMCGCAKGSFNTTSMECTKMTFADISAVQDCGSAYVRCLVNSSNAIAASPTGLTKCDVYAVALTRDYSDLYYSQNKSSTRLFQGCSSFLCNGAIEAVGVAANFSDVCTLTGLPPPTTNLPPATPAPTRMSCPQTLYPNFYPNYVPTSCTPSLSRCYSDFCSCLGGNFSGGSCVESLVMANASAAEKCMTVSMACILQSALGMYVPMTSLTSLDPCVRWPAQMAKAYNTFVSTAASSQASTDLVSGCSAVACVTLSTFYLGALDYKTACSFPTVTTTSLYADPILYTCPDGEKVAQALDCKCIQNASIVLGSPFFSPSAVTIDSDTPLTGTLYPTYRAATGPCSTSSAFESFLQYRWAVTDDATGSVLLTSATATLTIPRGTLTAGRLYRIAYNVTGLTSAAFNSGTRLVTTNAPSSIVNFKFGSNVRQSSQNAFVLVANVTMFGAVSQQSFLWTCVNSTSNPCPTFTGETTNVATIPVNAPPGDYVFTFTHSITFGTTTTSFSRSMNLTIVADVVPVAQIIITSVPVSLPATYLPSQNLRMVATYSASFTAAVDYEWSMGNTIVSTNRSLALTLESYTNTTFAVRLRVYASANHNTFGESSTYVTVLPLFSVGLSAQCSDCSGGANPVGLKNSLRFDVTLPLAVEAYNYQIVFSYLASGIGYVLPSKRSASSSYAAIAPLTPGGNAVNVDVTVTASLQINGFAASSSPNVPLTITTPNLTEAFATQIANVQNVKDGDSAIDAASTLQVMMQSNQLGDTQKKQLAATAVNVLIKKVGNADKLTPTQQSQLLTTLTTSIGTQKADESQRKAMSTAVLGVLSSLINSPTFSFASASETLAALDSCDPTVASTAMNDFAVKMTTNPNLIPGVVSVIAVGDLALSTLKDTPSSLTKGAMSSGNASLSIPADSGFTDGFPSDAMLALTSTSSKSNTLAKLNGSNPSDGVVTFDLTLGGAKQVVKNLKSNVAIAIKATAPARGSVLVCRFFDTVANVWSTDNVSTTVDASTGKVTCLTNHFTAFATFATAVAATPAPSTTTLSDTSKKCDGGCVAGVVLAAVGGTVIIVSIVVIVVKRRQRSALLEKIEAHEPHTAEPQQQQQGDGEQDEGTQNPFPEAATRN